MSSSCKILQSPAKGPLNIKKKTKQTLEEEKALRDQLHIEIENKTKACSNKAYECSLQRIDGYEYCIRHILQDPKAPYKQCTYIYESNGKRCTQATPRSDPKKDYGSHHCFEHSRHSQLLKTKTTVGKFKSIDTVETLLNSLSHHVKVEKGRPSKAIQQQQPHDEDDEAASGSTGASAVDPFLDLNCKTLNNAGRNILDFASDTSSDEEIPTLNNTWRQYDMDNSDNESVDSQNEDLLKHAGIYTTEEATKITKDKLVRLQSLYIDQFQRLKHVLRERRRKYLHALRRERETCMSIYNQAKENPREQKLYQKYKALQHYHKKFGVEAILYRKHVEKRAKVTDGLAQKPNQQTKCAFIEGGVKCVERPLPSAKHCRKHIFEDKKQVFFRPCNVEKSGVVCQEPVASIFEDSTCVLHIELPQPKVYMQKKYESESEHDDFEVKREIKDEPMDTVAMLEDNNVTIMHAATPPEPVDAGKEVERSDVNFTIAHD